MPEHGMVAAGVNESAGKAPVTDITRLQPTKENFMKKFPALNLRKWLILFLLAWLSSAQAGENEIRQSLQSKLPISASSNMSSKRPMPGFMK